MTEKQKLQLAFVGMFVAVAVAGMALMLSYRASSMPWRSYAQSQEKVVAFRELQLQQIQGAAQGIIDNALADEQAKFSDLYKLLQKYDEEAVLYFEANGGVPEGQLADAMERAQNRLADWSNIIQ